MTAQLNPFTGVRVVPAAADSWGDLESLFGKNGALAGCWCQYWRMERAQFKKARGEGTKTALRLMIENGELPGVLAYAAEEVVGWCSIGPREQFAALEASRTLKRVDALPVWAITCVYVARPWRRQGLLGALLNGAVEYAASQGARIVEGYPLDLQHPSLVGKKLAPLTCCMGIASTFRAAGFKEVARASETQAIMRYFVK